MNNVLFENLNFGTTKGEQLQSTWHLFSDFRSYGKVFEYGFVFCITSSNRIYDICFGQLNYRFVGEITSEQL